MIKIGILGCAEIAFRRFLPALMENKEFECVCIAEEYDKSKLEQFEKEFGIKSAENFQAIIEDENIVLFIFRCHRRCIFLMQKQH